MCAYAYLQEIVAALWTAGRRAPASSARRLGIFVFSAGNCWTLPVEAITLAEPLSEPEKFSCAKEFA
jgi:hypothetical protein